MRRSVCPVNGRVAMLLSGLAVWSGVCFGVPATASADETVVACGPAPNQVFGSSSAYSFTMQASCPGGTITLSTGQVQGFKKGMNAIWQAVAPTGLVIRSAFIPSMSESGVNAGSSGDYGGDFYWAGGSSNIVPGETSALLPGINSRDFGFNLVCGLSTCSGANAYAGIFVSEVLLTVGETAGPSLNSPSGLWQASGWVRGKWDLTLSGDSPSGMCSLSASFAGQSLPGSTSQPNQAVWHQCSAAAVNDPVETADYPRAGRPCRSAARTLPAYRCLSQRRSMSITNRRR